MKTIISTLAILIIAVVNAANENSMPKSVLEKKPSIAQRVGGFVIDYKAAKGKYVFINCQEKLDVKLIKGLSNGLKNDYSWIIEFMDGDKSVCTIKDAIVQKKKCEAIAATLFVYSDELPHTVTIPEENISIVNVKELMLDKPKTILLENRIVRAAMRGFSFSLGVGYSTYEAGVMHPISKASDLDRFSANFIPPDCANFALQNGSKIGFKPYRRTTYKRACKEGWAPAPTNEFQKAVWEKVRSEKERGPANPIEIPMPKKK